MAGNKTGIAIWGLSLSSSLLLSIPWLIPHTGVLALAAFIPLLFAEARAEKEGYRHFFICCFACFVLWNALTTFWVCNATVGGGIFAILANGFQMALVFAVFRISRRRFSGSLSYILLAATWLAWEHLYFNAQISWPWLTLGHAFATSTGSVQWYEYTGVLGGSLWIWASNLGLYAILSGLSDGSFRSLNTKARAASITVVVLVLIAPMLASRMLYNRAAAEIPGGSVDVVVAQPNYDPYEKFESWPQSMQNDTLLSLISGIPDSASVLFVAPETFTSDIILNGIETSPTWIAFNSFLQSKPSSSILYGASTYDISYRKSSPSPLARKYGDGWIVSHNSAILQSCGRPAEVFHKSKLVVGTELTPYPRVFVPFDNWLSGKLGVSGLMGRCVGQDEISLLHFNDSIPFGCAVCYESVYGDYCTGYVRKGARFLSVITNDAWWGDTPGYRQHLSYSALRAIELRRDIVRCGNTGISAIISSCGEIIASTPWWTRCTLEGSVSLRDNQTFFVRHGDIIGRVSVAYVILMLLTLLVNTLITKNKKK